MVGYGSRYVLRLPVLSKILFEGSIWTDEIHDDCVVDLQGKGCGLVGVWLGLLETKG